MKTPPKLTIEPLKGGGYRVFLDDFEITHCLEVKLDFELKELGGGAIPIAGIKLLSIVDAINMARISAINGGPSVDEAQG